MPPQHGLLVRSEKKSTDGVVQMVAHLPSKHEALSLNLNTMGEKKGRKKLDFSL
jgi:hypothetical protein